MKNKNNVFIDFLDMIKKSWTYDRMTKEEKEKIKELLTSGRLKEDIKGTYKQRYDALNGVYYAFLIGIGYDNFNWRGNNE